MAMAQVAARFVTEAAPPPVVQVVRRRKAPRSLDTIAEDERENQLELAYGGSDKGKDKDNLAVASDIASSSVGFAAAWSRPPQAPAPAPAPRSAGFVPLNSCFSHAAAHGRAGGWEPGRFVSL